MGVVPLLSQFRSCIGDFAVRSVLKLSTVLPSELIVHVPLEVDNQSPAVKGRGQHSVEGNIPNDFSNAYTSVFVFS